MKTYYIDDITKWYEGAIAVEANNIQEALKQAFPDRPLKRDYTNTGDIVVKAPYMTRYGRAYKTYVYCDSDAVLWTIRVKEVRE